MAKVPIGRAGRAFAEVDKEDLERCLALTWSPSISGGHLYGLNAKKGVLLHRFIINAPKGVSVKCLDGNPLNCHRSNLKLMLDGSLEELATAQMQHSDGSTTTKLISRVVKKLKDLPENISQYGECIIHYPIAKKFQCSFKRPIGARFLEGQLDTEEEAVAYYLNFMRLVGAQFYVEGDRTYGQTFEFVWDFPQHPKEFGIPYTPPSPAPTVQLAQLPQRVNAVPSGFGENLLSLAEEEFNRREQEREDEERIQSELKRNRDERGEPDGKDNTDA